MSKKQVSRHFRKFIILGEKFDINDFTTEEFAIFNKEMDEYNNNPDKFFEEYDPNRLHVQLIPKPMWGKNVRSSVSKGDWDRIRKEVYAKANNCCQICEEEVNSLHAHEVWNWNEETHVQKLVDIIGICPDCHNTVHYGRAQKIGKAREAVDQFMKVNFCDEYFEFKMELMEAQQDFFRRSDITDWKLDLSLIEKQGYKVKS